MANHSIPDSRFLDNSDSETWLPVLGYEAYYEVSDLGRVRRIKTGRILSPGDYRGYRFVSLSKNGKTQVFKIHVLVAAAFIGKRPDGNVVNHIDGNKSNNRASNLEYTTAQGNTRHAILNGLFPALSDETLERVYTLVKQETPHLTYAEIGEIVGMHPITVGKIARGQVTAYTLRGYKESVGLERRKIKLTTRDYQDIKQLLDEGVLSQTEIAKRYGIHHTTVSNIKTGKLSRKGGAK